MGVDIVFETSAVTTDDEAGVATGWLPGTLSERGRRCARELGERRADGLNAIFCSDLARAVETVRIAFPNREFPVHWDTRLRQCNYGVLNGAPLTEVADRRLRHLDEPFPGGQSYREVVEQVRGFLRDLAGAWDGARVLVVAHSANRWALEHLLNGADLAELVGAPTEWRPGWSYRLPADWGRRHPRPARAQPGRPADHSG
ncbi:histidine phosphatase family protein [Micromonospora sp. HM5-17]|jgi:broad specificity phosphatase PhoE|uniref:histidine phosphatase family protein n=1 Tax=Micromonospora sp. HM5-17 TaxID=2487710 RepID=UPI000F4A90E6|nr:histidine phosphatase family protein [Micromonospora sp. HM5-17]ROT33203.1 histidine phosphatase family protein [Micromonospora sp. HM5-17]